MTPGINGVPSRLLLAGFAEWFGALSGCFLALLAVFFVVWLLIGLISVSIRWLKQGRAAVRHSPRRGFPVIPQPVLPAGPAARGHRRYRVIGVDGLTRDDVALSLDALTAANAKVKAELMGVVVTEVVEE